MQCNTDNIENDKRTKENTTNKEDNAKVVSNIKLVMITISIHCSPTNPTAILSLIIQIQCRANNNWNKKL